MLGHPDNKFRSVQHPRPQRHKVVEVNKTEELLEQNATKKGTRRLNRSPRIK